MLVASSLKGLLLSQFASNGMTGSYDPNLCEALAQGITISILKTSQVQTTDSGMLGGGTGLGKVLGINPGVLTPLMKGQFASNGLLGTYGVNNLPTAISQGFCQWFNASNQTQTQHAGVGSGFGTGKVIVLDENDMKTTIIGFMQQNGIRGEYHSNVAKAAATAICMHVKMMGIVQTPISGGGALPGGGSGTGKII